MFYLRYLPFVIIGVLTLIIVVMNVKKNNFSEKDSLFWTIAGLIMILSPLYMGYVDRLAHFVGVDYPPALIFALIFIYVFFLLYRLSAAAHKQNERITELIQLNAIYENELRILKEKISKLESENNDVKGNHNV